MLVSTIVAYCVGSVPPTSIIMYKLKLIIIRSNVTGLQVRGENLYYRLQLHVIGSC